MREAVTIDAGTGPVTMLTAPVPACFGLGSKCEGWGMAALTVIERLE